MKQVILMDIRSKYNVGAIFRTSDAAGVSKVYLIGFTPTPIDRFGRIVSEIHKTALGAEKKIHWEKVEDIFVLIENKKKEGFTVVAVELAENSVLLTDYKCPEKVIYILGSEISGVPSEVQIASDLVLEIPMLGEKESLNVSVAAGIILYAV